MKGLHNLCLFVETASQSQLSGAGTSRLLACLRLPFDSGNLAELFVEWIEASASVLPVRGEIVFFDDPYSLRWGELETAGQTLADANNSSREQEVNCRIDGVPG